MDWKQLFHSIQRWFNFITFNEEKMWKRKPMLLICVFPPLLHYCTWVFVKVSVTQLKVMLTEAQSRLVTNAN